MNPNWLLTLAKGFLNPQQQRLLDDSMAKLNAYKQTHTVKNFGDVLQALTDLNVPKDFLSKTGGLVKNPLVSKIASACNVDPSKIQEDIQRLSNTSTSTGSLQGYIDDLNKLNRRK
ncbi:MAG: hypothetical protein II453_06955 [Alphaproteobacteria bacterium]|nr:hypothetical protein [Alphaproteobacteria bacterium]